MKFLILGLWYWKVSESVFFAVSTTLFLCIQLQKWFGTPKKNPSSSIKERFLNDDTFDIGDKTKIGSIRTISPNMEISFELSIQDMDSCNVDYRERVLIIKDYFRFAIRKSAQEARYYIDHEQFNGLGSHDEIQKSNPISYNSDNWQKEFL